MTAAWLVLLGCRDDERGVGRRHRPPPPPPTTEVTDAIPAGTGDTGPTTPPECLAPPPARATRVETLTLQSEEDFDFDDRGRLVAQRLYGLTAVTRDLRVELVAPLGFVDPSGLRVLPDGRFVAVDQTAGAVRVVDLETGASDVVLTGLTNANGLVTDRGGRGYAGESAQAGRVIGFDPDTGDTSLVGRFHYPNGLAFSPDERTLYVTTVSEVGDTIVVAIDRGDDGEFLPDTRRNLWSGDYELLSLAVDVCGNLYGVDYFRSTVLRISTDGVAVEIAKARGFSHSAVRFAPGFGGWDRTHLHVNARSDNKLDLLDVGIPGYHVLTPEQ